ncbi:hypothetical protein KI387_006784 [Taxus chinensis]|uniref:KAP NTPase domain-containing protein n=1 Tax=Taxus chinensis TaxID=29808 RepID=A0AA38GQ62_TAXCH|nr:hypothetical protein KI387_006784 [Taxus chinensis]
MPPIKLKFRKIDLPDEGIVLTNGYRLATVKEVRNNLRTITRLKLLDRSRMLLLDGCIFPDSRIERVPNLYCDWLLVVKEKEWNKDARIWKKKKSACYSSNGILLRTQLYDGITLSQQAREAALLNASFYQLTEVIYWLLKTTNPTEFDGFGNFFRKETRYLWQYGRMVGSLLASKFPLQLPLEKNEKGKTALDYAIKTIRSDNIDASILVVELFIELYSVGIVHTPTSEGVSFLDTATQNEWIPVLTKLLSILSQHSVSGLENQISKIKPRFGGVLIEAVERGYRQLAEVLLELQDCIEQITAEVCLEVLGGAVRKGYLKCMQKLLEPVLKKEVGNELQLDKHGKTLFYYAAETGNSEVFQLLAKSYQDEYKEKKRDKCGRNFLHWAALNGEANCCRDCIDEWKLKADAKDYWGQNSLHFSAKGNNGHQVVDILLKSSRPGLIYSRDGKGRTALHLASGKGNLKMVEKLFSSFPDNLSQMRTYIEQADGFGRTALQMAARGGHQKIVQLILDKDCDLLKQRDIHGCTALHYATQVKNAEVAVDISQRLLNKYKDSSEKKSLLLWAAADGIGTAEETEKVDPDVKEFLLREKERNKEHLLRAAATNNYEEMAWELLNRGANIEDIYDRDWKNQFRSNRNSTENVDRVINQIEIAKEQGSDKPSQEDNLGRNIFAEGLAALFLNKFVESPITVGISGEWGMGKSSLMIQTENILLLAASQLAFPNLVHCEDFVGAEKISLNTRGRKIYRKIKNGVYSLLAHRLREDTSGSVGLFSGLGGYIRKICERIGERKYRQNLLVEFLEKYYPQYHVIYKSLACTDLPNQTTRSNVQSPALGSQYQPLRGAPRILTIRYNAWHYRDEHEAWAGLAVTITKEIEQVMTRAQNFSTCWKYSWIKNSVNICLQIFFPCLLVTFLAGEWCLNWFGLYPDNVENTCVPKFSPASENQLRIITFVDDLDRCEEKVILQVLSAINLVLAECKINVVLGMDKKMIERAVRRNFEDNDDKDLADKFICKIIQIPLSLPDPTDEESNRFLHHQLKHEPPVTTPAALEDGGETDYGELDTDYEEEENAAERTVVDIDNSNRPRASSQGVMEKVLHWLGHLFQILCLLSCKLSSELREMHDELNEEKKRLTFSKGARLTREMLLSNYTPEEAETLYKLKRFASGIQKLPREWKLLLHYRILTSNILSMIGKVYNLPGWKVELMAWIFVCWQWKHEMNILIKDWRKHAVIKGKPVEDEDKDETEQDWQGPSLKQLVMNYVIELNALQQTSNVQAGEDKDHKFQSGTMETEEGIMKVRECLRQDPFVKAILSMYSHDTTIVEESPSRYLNWMNLFEALEVQDVSMRGIQLFQQFRLHCETDHLPWPLPESDESRFQKMIRKIQESSK